MRGPEVTVYPDSQKVGVYETMMSPERGGFGATFRIEDAVDYYDRERPSDLGGTAGNAPRRHEGTDA